MAQAPTGDLGSLLSDSLFFPDNIFGDDLGMGTKASIGLGAAAAGSHADPFTGMEGLPGSSSLTHASLPASQTGAGPSTVQEPPAKRYRPEKVPSESSLDLQDGGQHGGAGDLDAADSDSKEENRRERNRRHARETRLRKKEFVEGLKTKLDQLTQEKEALEKQIRTKDQLSQDKVDAWVKVLYSALVLRASAEPDASRWQEVMEDDVVLIHPITPYRSYRSADVISNRCVLMGIQDVIADSSSLQVALAAMCKSGIHSTEGQGPGTQERKLKVQVRFTLDEDAIHHSKTGLMCPFEMRSNNLAALGLKCEVAKHGSIRTTFSAAGKIKQMELYFDPISFWRQMQYASGVDEIVITPNTLTAALRPSSEARVVTEAQQPFRITHVNEAWTELCGFSSGEACGQTLRILQGQDTDKETVKKLVQDCVEGKATSMEVVNYDKDGSRFRNFLQVYPLACEDGAGEISHLLGVLKPMSEKF